MKGSARALAATQRAGSSSAVPTEPSMRRSLAQPNVDSDYEEPGADDEDADLYTSKEDRLRLEAMSKQERTRTLSDRSDKWKEAEVRRQDNEQQGSVEEQVRVWICFGLKSTTLSCTSTCCNPNMYLVFELH